MATSPRNDKSIRDKAAELLNISLNSLLSYTHDPVMMNHQEMEIYCKICDVCVSVLNCQDTLVRLDKQSHEWQKRINQEGAYV